VKKLSVLVVDDEKIMCTALRHQLEKFPYLKVVGECSDGQEALVAVERLQPDIVFLDIRMPGLSGLEVAAALDQLERSPEVVFVTAYDEYAVKAYEVGAIDYVLKPFDSEDIIRVLRKIRRLLTPPVPVQWKAAEASGETAPTKFCLYCDEQMEIVDSKNIKVFEIEQGKVYAFTLDETRYTVKQSLHEIEQLLDRKKFFRCHRNYIVNVDYVRAISPWFNRGLLLTLQGEKKKEIPVSRAQTKNLGQYINF